MVRLREPEAVLKQPTNPHFSPGHEARAQRWRQGQGERESGRAVVLDSTSSTLAAFNATPAVQSASAAGGLVRNAG